MSESPCHRPNTVKDQIDRRKIMAGNAFRREMSVGDCLSILKGNAGKYVKVIALATLFFKLVPGSRKFLVSRFGTQYDFSKTPINPDMYEIREKRIGLGYWTEVFLLEPKKEEFPRMVLKIEFPATPVPIELTRTPKFAHSVEY